MKSLIRDKLKVDAPPTENRRGSTFPLTSSITLVNKHSQLKLSYFKGET